MVIANVVIVYSRYLYLYVSLQQLIMVATGRKEHFYHINTCRVLSCAIMLQYPYINCWAILVLEIRPSKRPCMAFVANFVTEQNFKFTLNFVTVLVS